MNGKSDWRIVFISLAADNDANYGYSSSVLSSPERSNPSGLFAALLSWSARLANEFSSEISSLIPCRWSPRANTSNIRASTLCNIIHSYRHSRFCLDISSHFRTIHASMIDADNNKLKRRLPVSLRSLALVVCLRPLLLVWQEVREWKVYVFIRERSRAHSDTHLKQAKSTNRDCISNHTTSSRDLS